jgi:hypothetical protein
MGDQQINGNPQLMDHWPNMLIYWPNNGTLHIHVAGHNSSFYISPFPIWFLSHEMSTNTYSSAIDSPEILGFSHRPAAWPPKMGTPKRQRMDTTHLPEAVLSDPGLSLAQNTDAGAPSGLNHSVADQLCGQNPKHGGNKTPRSVVIVGYFVPLPCISKTDFVGSEKLNQIRFSHHHFGLQCQYLRDPYTRCPENEKHSLPLKKQQRFTICRTLLSMSSGKQKPSSDCRTRPSARRHDFHLDPLAPLPLRKPSITGTKSPKPTWNHVELNQPPLHDQTCLRPTRQRYHQRSIRPQWGWEITLRTCFHPGRCCQSHHTEV